MPQLWRCWVHRQDQSQAGVSRVYRMKIHHPDCPHCGEGDAEVHEAAYVEAGLEDGDGMEVECSSCGESYYVTLRLEARYEVGHVH